MFTFNAIDTAVVRRNLSKQKIYESKLDHTNIKITEKYVENESGDIIFTKLFEPKNPSKAKAIILHSVGFSARIGWVPHDFGVQSAQQGLIVFMFDHKGMGETDGRFCRIDDFDKDFVDRGIWIFNYAINEYIKSNDVYKKLIDKPQNYFLSGHSMGGASTIRIALKEQKKNTLNIKGIILIAPMCQIGADKMPSPVTLWILQNILLPVIPGARLINSGMDKTTLNHKVQEITDQDPIGDCNYIALITGMNLLQTTQFIQENAKNLKMPMLICQGDKDIATDCNGCAEFFDNCDQIKKEDKLMKIYQDKGHTLWLEEPEMINDVKEWINRYL